MSALQAVFALFRQEATQLESTVLLPDHVSPALPAQPMPAGAGYFRLWVKQMHLQYSRDWFASQYPVVHAVTAFEFNDPAVPLEIAQVAGPTRLKGLEAKNLGNVVGENYALTPLVPFRGGAVSFEAGLVSMVTDNVLVRFVDVMSSMAALTSMPQLSTAVTVAGTVSDGVQQLLGVGQSKVVLAYQDTFVGAGAIGGSPLAPTHVALFNAPKGRYPAEQLWLVDSTLSSGSDRASAVPISGVDFMLLTVETAAQRDDFELLTTINAPWTKAIEALAQLDPNTGEPKLSEAEAFVRAAAAAALNSPDLTEGDRIRVARAIRARFTAYKDALYGEVDKGGELPAPPSLAEVGRAAVEMPAEPATIGELFPV